MNWVRKSRMTSASKTHSCWGNAKDHRKVPQVFFMELKKGVKTPLKLVLKRHHRLQLKNQQKTDEQLRSHGRQLFQKWTGTEKGRGEWRMGKKKLGGI